ncbi:MAG: methyltransferase domain-containing protein [Candidatus Andersenbacteria bacterium]
MSILAARAVGPVGVVYAVDILQDNLRAIRSQAALFGLPNVVTIWADLEVPGSTKIPNDTCDATLLFKVLCQQEAHEKTLREAVRITKPGGRVILTEWAEARFGFCPPERIVQKPQAVQLARNLGLELVEEHTIDSFHYMLEFKKVAARTI